VFINFRLPVSEGTLIKMRHFAYEDNYKHKHCGHKLLEKAKDERKVGTPERLIFNMRGNPQKKAGDQQIEADVNREESYSQSQIQSANFL
jgi:hypothetical protein